MSKRFITMVILATIVGIMAVYFAGLGIKNISEKNSLHKFEAVVEKVVDGDTVVTDAGEKVRFLGVDTPELHHPDRPEEPFAQEAKQYVKERIEGKKCVFEYTDRDHYDKYGRTLAFIYIDGDLLNSELVKKGYGYASVSKFISKTKEFLVLENIAKKFRLGLWQYKEGGQKKK